MVAENLTKNAHPRSSRNGQLAKVGRVASFRDRLSLDGQTALVAGTSSEMMSAIALALGRVGAKVALTARTTELLGTMIQEVETKGIRVSRSTVADHTDVSGGIARIVEQLGRIDILVIAADDYGFTAPHIGAPADIIAERAERVVVDVNSGCDAMAAHMANAGSGSVTIITNPATSRPWPEFTATVLRLALVDLTKKLAQEWALRGVRFNIVTPGVQCDVPGNERTWPVALDSQVFRHSRAIYSLTDAVAWLASSAASRVTGAHISVDGYFCHDLIDDWRHLLDVSSKPSASTSSHPRRY
jgi:NAD(P)-dependent dehydrogenase (short-subunit alcohol dehydrogenase family)